MDDLQFRRTIYADPHSADEDVKQAAENDVKKQKFWQEIKQLDESIASASKVSVPEGLAEKLILKQSVQVHKKQRQRSYVQLAAAASIAFVIGLSFSIFKQTDTNYLGEHAIAHVTLEGDGYALRSNGDFSLENVNFQLADVGAEFTQKIGRISFANYCVFENVRSYHMVIETDSGEKLTVFVVPNSKKVQAQGSFTGGNLTGEIFSTHHTSVIVVGEEAESVEQTKEKLQKTMLFSA